MGSIAILETTQRQNSFWWMYEPDIDLPNEHWEIYATAFMLNDNDNYPYGGDVA